MKNQIDWETGTFFYCFDGNKDFTTFSLGLFSVSFVQTDFIYFSDNTVAKTKSINC